MTLTSSNWKKNIAVDATVEYYPFDAHCCHIGTAIKHPVPDQVKQ